MSRSESESSKPCRMFQQSGSCRWGDECKFSHDVDTSTEVSTIPGLELHAQVGSAAAAFLAKVDPAYRGAHVGHVPGHMKGHTHPGLMYARRSVEAAVCARFPDNSRICMIGGDARRAVLYPLPVVRCHVCMPPFEPESERKWSEWAAWSRANKRDLDFCRNAEFHKIQVDGKEVYPDFYVIQSCPEYWTCDFVNELVERLEEFQRTMTTAIFMLDFYFVGNVGSELVPDDNSSNVLPEVAWDRYTHRLRLGDFNLAFHDYPWRNLESSVFEVGNRRLRADVAGLWGNQRFGYALLMLSLPDHLERILQPPAEPKEKTYTWVEPAVLRFWNWSLPISWGTKHRSVDLPKGVVQRVLSNTYGAARDERLYSKLCHDAKLAIRELHPELEEDIATVTSDVVSYVASELPKEENMLASFRWSWGIRSWAARTVSQPLFGVPLWAAVVAFVAWRYLRVRPACMTRPLIEVQQRVGGIDYASRLIPFVLFGTVVHAPVVFESVCHRGKTVLPLARGARITRPENEECKVTFDSVVCGPVPAMSGCYTNRACMHNEYSAAHDRVCSRKGVTTSEQWEKLLAVMRGCVVAYVTRTPEQVWAKRFPTVKQLRHIAAWTNTAGVSCETDDHHREAFVKREHNICLTELVPDKVPRLISGCKAASETVFGPPSFDFTRMIAEALPADGPVVYAWGLTAEQLGEWHDLWAPEHWLGGEGDFSKMDRDEGEESQMIFDRGLYRLVEPNIVGMWSQHAAGHGRTRHAVKYHVDYVMSSGRGDTHGANSAKTGAVLIYSARTITRDGCIVPQHSRESIYAEHRIAAIIGGDDTAFFTPPSDLGFLEHYEETAKASGFTLEASRMPHWHTRFYSARFWPHQDGTLLTGLPGRHLLKAYLATGLRPTLSSMTAWAHSTAQCHMVAYQHVPIASTLHARVLRLSTGSSDVERQQYRFERAHLKTAQSYEHMSELYGTSVSDIVDAERVVDSIRSLHTAWGHPVLERMVQVDVASWTAPFRWAAKWIEWHVRLAWWKLPHWSGHAAFALCRNALNRSQTLQAAFRWAAQQSYAQLYAIGLGPVLEELVKRAHPLMPFALAAAEAADSIPVVEGQVVLTPQWLTGRLMTGILHVAWANMPYFTAVCCHALFNIAALYLVPGSPGCLGYRNVHPVSMPPKQSTPKKNGKLRASGPPRVAPKSANPNPRTMSLKQGTPPREHNTTTELDVPGMRRRRADRNVGIRLAPTSQVDIASDHNAAASLVAMSKPLETEPMRYPDGFAASVAVKNVYRMTMPIAQSPSNTTAVGGLIFMPGLAQHRYRVGAVTDAGVVTYNPVEAHPRAVEYEADFHMYRVTAVGIRVHNYEEVLTRGSLCAAALLPSTDVGELPGIGTNIWSDFTSYPRAKVMTTTEEKIDDRPAEFVWFPISFQSAIGQSGFASARPTGLGWKHCNSTPSAVEVEDQALMFLVYHSSASAGTAIDDLEVEVCVHFEFIPYYNTWALYAPRKAIGSTDAVERVADAVTMGSGVASEDPQSFAGAVVRSAGSFLDTAKGFVEKAAAANKSVAIAGGLPGQALNWASRLPGKVGDIARTVSKIGQKVLDAVGWVGGLFGSRRENRVPRELWVAQRYLHLRALSLGCSRASPYWDADVHASLLEGGVQSATKVMDTVISEMTEGVNAPPIVVQYPKALFTPARTR